MENRPGIFWRSIFGRLVFWVATVIFVFLVLLIAFGVVWFVLEKYDPIFVREQQAEKEGAAQAGKKAAQAEKEKEEARLEYETFTRDAPAESNYSIWPSFADHEIKWDNKNLSTGFGLTENLAFSPDGKQLAVSGINSTLQFWDVLSGEKLKEIPPEKGRLRPEVIYSHMTRHYLLTSSGFSSLCDGDTHAVLNTVLDHGVGDISPNGKYFALPTFNKIDFYCLPSGKPSRIKSLSFEEAGLPLIRFASNDYLITHFGTDFGREAVRTVVRRVSGPGYYGAMSDFTGTRVNGVRLSQDRSLVYHVSRSGLFGPGWLEGTLRFHNWKKDKCAARLEFEKGKGYLPVLTPDGKQVITAQNNGEIHFWELSTRQKSHFFRVFPEEFGFQQIEISPNGLVLAVSSRGMVYLCNLKSVMKRLP